MFEFTYHYIGVNVQYVECLIRLCFVLYVKIFKCSRNLTVQQEKDCTKDKKLTFELFQLKKQILVDKQQQLCTVWSF